MNRADVEMLDQAMQGMGNSFFQNRALHQKASEDALDRAMRERMLSEQVAGRKDVANQMAGARKEQAQAYQEHWKEMENRLQDQVDAKKQQTQAMTDSKDLQDKQALLKSFIELNASDMLSDDGLDHVNDFLSTDPHFAPTGIQLKKSPKPLPAQVGQNSLAAALQQADSWGQKADAARAAGDSSKAAEYDKYKNQLTDSVDPTAYDTITTRVPDPNNPGKFLEERTHKVKRDAPAAGISAAGFQQWKNSSAPGSGLPINPANNPLGLPVPGQAPTAPNWDSIVNGP